MWSAAGKHGENMQGDGTNMVGVNIAKMANDLVDVAKDKYKVGNIGSVDPSANAGLSGEQRLLLSHQGQVGAE